MRRIPLLALALLCTLPRAAQPQADRSAVPERVRANRSGFFIGFDPIVYASLRSDELTGGAARGGTGVSLRFGWGFSDRLAILMDVPVTDLPVADSADYLLSTGDVALQYRFAPFDVGTRALLPFVQLGFGIRTLDATRYGAGGPQIYSLAGEVLTLGLGTAYYFTPSIAATLQGWWSTGEFNDERIGNTTTHNRGIAATSTRIQAGLEWHRGRK